MDRIEIRRSSQGVSKIVPWSPRVRPAGIKYKIDQFPKIHCCGMAYSEDEWKRLEFAFVQHSVHNGKRYYHDLEGRQCECGSTICVCVEDL